MTELPGAPLARFDLVAAHLRRRIANGALTQGQRLAPELELAREFGVSRVTVRKALDVLKGEGLVRSRQGLGTFVRFSPAGQTLDGLQTLESSLQSQGLDATTTVLSFAYGMPSSAVAAALDLAPGEEVLTVGRLHSAGGAAVGFVELTVPALIGRLCTRQSVEESPFYDILPNLGVHIAHARQVIRAGSATKQFAALTGTRTNAPVLICERVTFDRGERPIIHARFTFRSDRFEFSVDLPADRDRSSWQPPGLGVAAGTASRTAQPPTTAGTGAR